MDRLTVKKKKRKKIGKLREKKHKDKSVKETRRCVCTQARKSTRETLWPIGPDSESSDALLDPHQNPAVAFPSSIGFEYIRISTITSLLTYL